ncbi:ABC transporter ATP-binding protein [Rhizobium leguminosarum]|uniref:ABC transporter ATP-binding protein n=1 Tax=Rhizobium leguminosarum TaxID=384 RepID=UPI003F9A8F49
MAPVLHADGLTRSFGSIVVADDLSFSVDMSECLGVIGPNGAGKTSVFNILAGAIQPQSGKVFLDGRDITACSQFERTRLGIGRTYQVPRPFGLLTAFENVLTAATFGGGRKGREADNFAFEILDRTGLVGRADMAAGSLPLLDRKRLELARAMALTPRLLLLDEIAGGLTEAEVGQLVELIVSIKKDLAIVWIEHVTHALQAAADRIVAINTGRKIAEGLPQDVMADAAVQEIYMGAMLDAAAVG